MGVIGLVRRLVWLGCTVLALTVGAVLWCAYANLRDFGRWPDAEAPADAIVLLGGGVDGDGAIGYSSRRRVAAAVELLRDGKARFLILTGGPGLYHPGAPAAILMRDHALALGAPIEALIVEPRSATTFQNLRFAFDIAAARGLERLALLTDAFHAERAGRLAAYFGHPGIRLVAVDGLDRDTLGNRVVSILREALSWWYNLAKIAAWEVLTLAGVGVEARSELIR